MSIEGAIYTLLSGASEITDKLATYNGYPAVFSFSPIPSDCQNPAITIESLAATTSNAVNRAKRGGEMFVDVSIWGDKDQSEKEIRDVAWDMWKQLDRGILTASGLSIIACFAGAPVRLSDPENFPGYLVSCRVIFTEA